jgi:hypothetical protein
MQRIFVHTKGPKDWRRVLAQPRKHWKKGYSARALAHCWEEREGFPVEIERLFAESGHAAFRDIEPLLIFAEYKVPLPGGRRASQSDVFVLAQSAQGLVTIAVEGKASETFGLTVEQWLDKASEGKKTRLAYLQKTLALPQVAPHIRYQLLHRAGSAVAEAHRFGAPTAVMLIHSFSQEDEGLVDYQAFLELFGVQGGPGQLAGVRKTQGVDLYCGWVRGDEKYLRM